MICNPLSVSDLVRIEFHTQEGCPICRPTKDWVLLPLIQLQVIDVVEKDVRVHEVLDENEYFNNGGISTPLIKIECGPEESSRCIYLGIRKGFKQPILAISILMMDILDELEKRLVTKNGTPYTKDDFINNHTALTILYKVYEKIKEAETKQGPGGEPA